MARPRKNIEALQGAYTKEAMQERLEQDKRLKGNKDKLIAPAFIENDQVALDKFNSLIRELSSCDLINNVDVDLLAVYADSWSKYMKATIMLSKQDMVEEQESKTGITKVQNPYIKIQQSYSQQLLKISNLFGLSPADRSKIAHLEPSSKEEKTDPLMDLLKGLKS